MFQQLISISLLSSKEFLTCQLETLVCRSFLTQVSGCLNNPLVSKFIPSGPHHEHQGLTSSLSLENSWMLLFTFLASIPVPQVTCQFLERRVGLKLSTLSTCFLETERIGLPREKLIPVRWGLAKAEGPLSASSWCHSRQLPPSLHTNFTGDKPCLCSCPL